MDLKELVDVDFPNLEITEETGRLTKTSQNCRYGSVHVRFFTDESYAKYRKEVLSQPIP